MSNAVPGRLRILGGNGCRDRGKARGESDSFRLRIFIQAHRRSAAASFLDVHASQPGGYPGKFGQAQNSEAAIVRLTVVSLMAPRPARALRELQSQVAIKCQQVYVRGKS